jgi:hypothetical protein
LAKGAVGDAYPKEPTKRALENYKAVDANKMISQHSFLVKTGKTALALGDKEAALKYFTNIKENFQSAPEAASVDALIGFVSIKTKVKGWQLHFIKSNFNKCNCQLFESNY